MNPVYALRVFYPGDDRPRKEVALDSGALVLEAIPDLLREHDGCERIEVFAGPTKLFSVDCPGQTRAG